MKHWASRNPSFKEEVESDTHFYSYYLSELKSLINKAVFLVELRFSNALERFEKSISFEADDESLYVQVRTALKTRSLVLTLLKTLLEEENESASETESLGVSLDQSIETRSEKVFVVHGHDDSAKQTVARFLEKLNLEVVILHEQSSGGKTIIEKLEHYTNVDFALILLTPDDIGGFAHDKSNPDKLSLRARQNVVLELGYLMAKIGRSRVCALVKGNLEKPTDYSGVIYISMDENEGWKKHVFKELLAAGINVIAEDFVRAG